MMNATETLTKGQLQEIEEVLVSEQARLKRFLPEADARHDAVLEALRRLEEGTYGICTYCNSQIPYGRLIVMPESDHCVGCGPRS